MIPRRIRSGALAIALFAFLALVPAVALADDPIQEAEPPLLNGGMDFPAIQSVNDPEEFSWTVQLGEGQELRQIDEHEVAAYWGDGKHLALDFFATPAHDAEGASVPTTLELIGEKVIALTVHHREGNPAAGGAPFDYPILSGEGWEGGFTTTVIQGPPDEKELREQREHREREEREAREGAFATGPEPAVAPVCRVPELRGATLDGARNRLRRAHCRLGSIAKAPGATASACRVVGQATASGNFLPSGAKVSVRLGPAASPSRRSAR